MTPEQVPPRNWAAQILAPTARDIVPPVDEPPEAPAPEELPARRPVFVGQDEREAPTPGAAVTEDAFWSAATAEPAEAVSPAVANTSEVHRRIMSVARATERCARVLSGLAERVDLLDEKLAARDAVAPPPAPPEAPPGPPPEAPPGPPPGSPPELMLMRDQIGRLAAEVAQTHERVTERFVATEALQSELGALGSDIGAVQERLEEVARAQRVQQTAMSSSPVVQAMQRSLGELRAELATVGSRLVGVDARLDELQSLPARMEEMAASHVQRLVSEVLSVPDDLEGVYRELERIAERMAAREQAVAGVIERVAAAEEAVTGLRLDLDRVIGGLAAVREAEADAREWREAMEHRMAALEAPGSEVERLYRALDRMVGEQATADPLGKAAGEEEAGNGVHGSAGAPPGAGDGGYGAKATLATGSGHSQQAVEALTAELERIRRSIEVLVRPGARPPSGRAHR